MSTSKDPTVWLRNRKLLRDRHVRLAEYVTGELHSHRRPVIQLSGYVLADTPENTGYKHDE